MRRRSFAQSWPACSWLRSGAFRTIPSSTPLTSTPGLERSSAIRTKSSAQLTTPPPRPISFSRLERDKSIGEEDLVSGPVLTSGASGSSPAAILEQETEDLHHDRERVEEKESDTALSAADPAILESPTTRTNASAPARESTQYAARYEPGSGTVNVHAKQTATDRRSTVDAPGGDSLAEAKSITAKVLGDSAKTLRRADRERQLSRPHHWRDGASRHPAPIRPHRHRSSEGPARSAAADWRKRANQLLPIPKARSANSASAPRRKDRSR